MSRFALLLWLCALVGATDAALAHTPPATPAQILASVRQATGGTAWDQFAQCDSVGTIAFEELHGETGTFHQWENLKAGSRVLRVELPSRGVNQAIGIDLNGSWNQEDSGDIRLSPPDNPWDTDELYLTRHFYFRPDFGGAMVTALAPARESAATFDRLQFQVPHGRGFTVWVNRGSHLIERIVFQKPGKDADATKYFSDYRSVDGLLLPFVERSGNPGEEHTVTLSHRALLKQVNATNFAIPFRKDYQLPPSGMVTVPTENGILFRATINGNGPYRMLFDTGSVNLLSSDFAKKLGLSLDGQPLKFATAGGTVDARATHVDALNIGGLIVHDQTFYILALPWKGADDPVGAVGYELLRRLAVNIDYQHARLTFYDAPTFSYSGQGVKLPLMLEGKTLEVNGRPDGVDGLFALDTGNQVAFSLEPAFVNSNDLIHRLHARFHGYSGAGLGGPTPDAYYARVNTLQLGDTQVHDVIAHLYTGDPAPSDFAGNIGHSILQQFNVTFDLMRGNLFLEKNDFWGKPVIFNRAGILLERIDQGQKIMTVLPGSPGEIAGLKVGDVITAIGDKVPLPPGDDPNEPAFLQPVGTVVHLTAARGQSVLQFDVQLKEVL